MANKFSIILLICLSLLIHVSFSYSQDGETSAEKDKDRRPVNPPFDAGMLIDNQTVVIPSARTLEFMIQHRFGTLNNNSFDLAGLYAPSNIRLGLRYSITDYLQLGIGTTKTNKLQDLNWKWGILQQSRSGSIPVGLTYFGNVAVNVREKQSFGQEYAFTDRLSYFHQLITSRRFGPRLSLQASIEFAYFNQVDTIAFPGLKHYNLAASLSGRYKVTPQIGIIFNYHQPLTTPEQIKPNSGLGIEISTLGHSFQIFIGSYNKIIPQHNLTFNTNDFTDKDLLLGFNINRLWNF